MDERVREKSDLDLGHVRGTDRRKRSTHLRENLTSFLERWVKRYVAWTSGKWCRIACCIVNCVVGDHWHAAGRASGRGQCTL